MLAGSDPFRAEGQVASTPEAHETPTLLEYGEIRVPVSAVMKGGRFDFYSDAVRKELFEVRVKGQEIVVKAGHFLGLIAVSERLNIEVVARVPAAQLGRILRVAGKVPIEADRLTREYAISSDPHPPVLDIFVRALLRALQPIETEGIYRRYERHEVTGAFPRGRFLLTETVLRDRARGRLQATTSVFDHSKDNGPNQVIKLALWHAAASIAARARGKGDQWLLGEINRSFRLFDGVQLDLSLSCLRDAEVRDPSLLPSTREYYAAAIRLAGVIVEGHSIELDRIGDDLRLPALLIDLQDAFEAYLLATLRSRLLRVHRGLEVVTGNKLEPIGGGKRLFDAGADIPAKPDLVFRIGSGDGRFRLVGEVKYIDRDFSRDHINQALAYAVSYRTPVVLIRPRLRDESSGLTELGTVNGITAHRYLVDLAGDLLQEELAFAVAMRSLIPLAPGASVA